MTPERPLPSSPDAPATPESRERTVQLLSARFADDRLSLDELERRLELVYKAQSEAELERLVADLAPAGGALVAPGSAPLLAHAEEAPEHGQVIAVLSGNIRRGSWIVPRHLRVVAVLGGAELDLREARFVEGVTEIDVTAVLGAVELLVPPGVYVQCDGGAFLGAFEAEQDVGTASSRVVVRLTGTAVLGNVSAITRPALAAGAGRGAPELRPPDEPPRTLPGS